MTKVIIVPQSNFTSPRTLPLTMHPAWVMNENIAQSVMGLGGTVEIPSQFMHDPMVDYIAWYGGVGMYTTIHDVMLQERFWSMADLNDWLDTNMRRWVLVQRVDGGTSWKIVFTDTADYQRFTNFFHYVGKWSFEFKNSTEALFNEMKVWANENIGSGGYEHVRSYGSRGDGRITFHFRVKSKTDATAFKLRWHGVVPEEVEA